jgi:hypothetical protein
MDGELRAEEDRLQSDRMSRLIRRPTDPPLRLCYDINEFLRDDSVTSAMAATL